MNKPKKFLVVYEDEWNNKVSFATNKIGTTIKKIFEEFQIQSEEPMMEEDFKYYNSKDPYQLGTFNKGFYDIYVVRSEQELEDQEPEPAGKIMIFDVENS